MVHSLSSLFLFGLLQAPNERPVPFEQGEYWGYKDGAGAVVIAPRYHSAGEFSDSGIAAVADENGWAFINSKGAILVRPYVFDNGPDYFSEGLARFVVDGKFGFFDERGRVVIPHRFDFAEPFHAGLAVFCEKCTREREGEHAAVKGGKWGYVDRRGRVVIPAQYDEAHPAETGRVRVRAGSEWKTLDTRGRAVGK